MVGVCFMSKILQLDAPISLSGFVGGIFAQIPSGELRKIIDYRHQKCPHDGCHSAVYHAVLEGPGTLQASNCPKHGWTLYSLSGAV